MTNPDNDKDIDYNKTHHVVRRIVKWKVRFRDIQQSSGGLCFAPPECCSDNTDRNAA